MDSSSTTEGTVPSNEKFDELIGVAPEEAATSPRPRSGSFADMADNVKTAASEKATQAAEKAGEAAAAAKLKAKALAERTKDSIEVGSIMAEKGFYVGSRVVKEMLGVAKNSTAMPTEQETLANITEQWTRTAAYGVTFSETSKVGSTGQSPLGGWAHAGWSCVSQLCMFKNRQSRLSRVGPQHAAWLFSPSSRPLGNN